MKSKHYSYQMNSFNREILEIQFMFYFDLIWFDIFEAFVQDLCCNQMKMNIQWIQWNQWWHSFLQRALQLSQSHPCLHSLPSSNEVCKGYVFTGVCLSTGGRRSLSGEGLHSGEGCLSRGGLCPGGFSVQGISVQGSFSRGARVQGHLCPGASLSGGSLSWRPSPHMVMSGRYASYRNAFLFLQFTLLTRSICTTLENPMTTDSTTRSSVFISEMLGSFIFLSLVTSRCPVMSVIIEADKSLKYELRSI